MAISISTTMIHTDRPVTHTPTVLRGFFGRYQPQNILLHQHMENGKTAYLYPRVQYRIANGVPQLIGISEGTTAVEEAVQNLESLQLKNDTYNVNFVDTTTSEFVFAETQEQLEYRFASPWLALSQKNHKIYVSSNTFDQNELLKRILIGNLLSTSKSCDVMVTEKLTCELFIRAQPVFVKRQRMIGFVGRFRVNFDIPAMIGLGHLVSIGFGDVRLNQRRTVPH